MIKILTSIVDSVKKSLYANYDIPLQQLPLNMNRNSEMAKEAIIPEYLPGKSWMVPKKCQPLQGVAKNLLPPTGASTYFQKLSA